VRELLWWVFGFVCVAIAVLKVIATVWILIDLNRKWRTIPELWGVDWLDIVYRIERAFGVSLTASDFQHWTPDARVGLTAGQLLELVAHKLEAAGKELPADCWNRLVLVLGDALNIRAHRIRTESRLYADLSMGYGID
jgi:hypothetical protein